MSITPVNSSLGIIQGDFSYFLLSVFYVSIFCGFYLLSTLFKIKLDITYRLPLFRILLWSLLVSLELLIIKEGILETWNYILELNNSAFLLFYNTLLFKIFNGNTGVSFFEIYGFGIIGIGLYEFIIIKLSTIIADRLTHTKTSNASHHE